MNLSDEEKKIIKIRLKRRIHAALGRIQSLPKHLRDERTKEVIKRNIYKEIKMICPTCKTEKNILTDGKYAIVLECNHVVTNVSVANVVKHGVSGVEAVSISESLNKVRELPKIDSKELIERALSSMSQTYEEFFNAENPIIEDMINEHGKENAVLMFTAIHSHMSRVLFTLNRFRNHYFTQIQQMQKEVENQAVKDLISNHEFHYTPSDKKPKKIITKLSKTGTDIDKAKEAIGKLTDKDGNPIDVTKVLASLMWKKSPAELAKDSEKESYKEGLNKIKESITGKS